MKSTEEKQAVYSKLTEKSGTIMAALEELPEGVQINQEKYQNLDVETAQILNEMADEYSAGNKNKAVSIGLEHDIFLLKLPKTGKNRNVQVPPRATGVKKLFQNFSEACARLRDDPEQRRIDRDRGLKAAMRLKEISQEIRRREAAGKG